MSENCADFDNIGLRQIRRNCANMPKPFPSQMLPSAINTLRDRPKSKSIPPLKYCPGCGHGELINHWKIARQPAILNYRFASPADAMRVPRRDLRLAQCAQCGLVFNIALDAAAVPYDANYENRQCFSEAFREHLRGVVKWILTRHDLSGGRILEVGCGKGDFLKLLCAGAGSSGVGYDTTYEGEAEISNPPLQFHRRYVAAKDIRTRFDAIVCRHVVEHVGTIGAFLAELHAIAIKAGNPVVVIETPDFEWTAKNGCFWDVFYEHCNYFTRPCLAYLCRRAGFDVVRQDLVFDQQYQLLELKVRRGPALQLQPPGVSVPLSLFTSRADAPLRRMEAALRDHGAERGWAIWGAGAKGVALVNRLQRLPPRFVIDSNAAKAGCFIPGSRIPVISPDDPRIQELELVLIANPIYAGEITSALRTAGYGKTILTAGFHEKKSAAIP